MSVQILLDGQPCGVTCLSGESAREYIGRQHPDVRPRLSWREKTRNDGNGHGLSSGGGVPPGGGMIARAPGSCDQLPVVGAGPGHTVRESRPPGRLHKISDTRPTPEASA